MDVRRVRVIVHGIVQGVSYRASTQARARPLNVVGWVENQRDGTVRLEAQGPAADVEALIAWCRVGPPFAEVSHIDVEELAPTASGTGFVIR